MIINIDNDIDVDTVQHGDNEYLKVEPITFINAMSISIPNEKGTKYELNDWDIDPAREQQIEIYNYHGYGDYAYLNYRIGEITPERIGYTIEKRIERIATVDKIIAIAFLLLDLLAIVFGLYAGSLKKETNMPKCHHCGMTNEKGSVYCRKCGSMLATTKSEDELPF